MWLTLFKNLNPKYFVHFVYHFFSQKVCSKIIKDDLKIEPMCYNLECGICNGAHDTGWCPFKEEMKRFAPSGSTTEGSRHFKLCDYSGHNAASCHAKRAWLEYKISNCHLPNIESWTKLVGV